MLEPWLGRRRNCLTKFESSLAVGSTKQNLAYRFHIAGGLSLPGCKDAGRDEAREQHIKRGGACMSKGVVNLAQGWSCSSIMALLFTRRINLK